MESVAGVEPTDISSATGETSLLPPLFFEAIRLIETLRLCPCSLSESESPSLLSPPTRPGRRMLAERLLFRDSCGERSSTLGSNGPLGCRRGRHIGKVARPASPSAPPPVRPATSSAPPAELLLGLLSELQGDAREQNIEPLSSPLERAVNSDCRGRCSDAAWGDGSFRGSTGGVRSSTLDMRSARAQPF
mmetsp:Transcript_15230/g.25934  ORF Transcript_15230/g.25934 Transcript_15230/m.25934 type:complete len:190 (+) Transcript_15230:207-776(+)